MFTRLIVGMGLIAIGFYIGREIGRSEAVREVLRRNATSERLQASTHAAARPARQGA